jgi:hypothetical protein
MAYRRFDDRIVVLLGGNRKQQLSRLCAEDRVTLSDLIRGLVDREIARRNHPSAPAALGSSDRCCSYASAPYDQ